MYQFVSRKFVMVLALVCGAYVLGMLVALGYEVDMINEGSPVAHQLPDGTPYSTFKFFTKIAISMIFSWVSVFYILKRCDEEGNKLSAS